MGYEVYITRAEDWLDTEKHPISVEEWQAVLDQDESLRVDKNHWYDRKADGGGIERLYGIAWVGREGENAFWFVDGAVSCKNPSETWIAKMVAIAESLDARVIGEEGERYFPGGRVVTVEQQVDPSAERDFFWLGLLACVVMAVVLAGIPLTVALRLNPWMGVVASVLSLICWSRYGPRPMPGLVPGAVCVGGLLFLLVVLVECVLMALGVWK